VYTHVRNKDSTPDAMSTGRFGADHRVSVVLQGQIMYQQKVTGITTELLQRRADLSYAPN